MFNNSKEIIQMYYNFIYFVHSKFLLFIKTIKLFISIEKYKF